MYLCHLLSNYIYLTISISLTKSTTYIIKFTRNNQIIKVALQFKLNKYLHCIFKNFTCPSQCNDAMRTRTPGPEQDVDAEDEIDIEVMAR